jgi:hypothetical protein
MARDCDNEGLGPTDKGAEGEGRDASSGRFVKGWKGGPGGDPYARRVAELRSALIRAVSVDDIRDVVLKLLETAKGGDVQAARLLLGYCVGKPPELDQETAPITIVFRRPAMDPAAVSDAIDAPRPATPAAP